MTEASLAAPRVSVVSALDSSIHPWSPTPPCKSLGGCLLQNGDFPGGTFAGEILPAGAFPARAPVGKVLTSGAIPDEALSGRAPQGGAVVDGTCKGRLPQVGHSREALSDGGDRWLYLSLSTMDYTSPHHVRQPPTIDTSF